MTVVAVIPARGGSKRIPRKNLEDVAGETLLARSIRSAHESTRIDELVVSTDDDEIAAEAERCGIPVGFRRSAELSGDEAGDQGVLGDAVGRLAERGIDASVVVLLRPTAPFRRASTIDRCVDELLRSGAEVVRTVRRVDGIGHPYWCLREDADGWAAPFIEGTDMKRFGRSQSLPAAFHLTGVVDVLKASVLEKPDYVWGRPTRMVEVDDIEAIDIDTETDLVIARSIAESVPERTA